MCTGLIKKGNDIIYGFNLDLDPEVYDYAVYKNSNHFTVGLKIGSTVYYTHGVTKEGKFGNIPYMNGEKFPVKKGIRRERIDLMIDRYIRNRYSFEDISEIIQKKAIVDGSNVSLHSLIANPKGDILLVEPGYGSKTINEDYAVISNFPILTTLTDDNPFYGKDRYEKVTEILKNADDSFNVSDAIRLLESVKQDGQWGTRVSFVYSLNQKKVWYCFDGNFDQIQIHSF